MTHFGQLSNGILRHRGGVEFLNLELLYLGLQELLELVLGLGPHLGHFQPNQMGRRGRNEPNLPQLGIPRHFAHGVVERHERMVLVRLGEAPILFTLLKLGFD